MEWKAASVTGPVRAQNEDDYCVNTAYRLFAVADGMGGHKAGEVASRMALRALEAGYTRLVDRGVAPAEALPQAVRDANNEVFTAACRNREYLGMGTTLAACVFLADGLVVAHVGDSRVYLVRNGEAQRLTEDHSVVQELINQGKLSPAEAGEHPYRNVLSRALGTEGGVDVDVRRYPAAGGDRVLLCTDGLTGLVRDAEIARIVGAVRDPGACAEQLVSLALQRGGRDNVTLVLVVFEGL